MKKLLAFKMAILSCLVCYTLYVVSIDISNDPVKEGIYSIYIENRKILLVTVWRLPMSAYKHDVLFNY